MNHENILLKNLIFFSQNSGDPDSSQNENNNIDSFGSKRLRLDGEAESPLTPPSFKENKLNIVPTWTW